jgi:hypothetical protein
MLTHAPSGWVDTYATPDQGSHHALRVVLTRLWPVPSSWVLYAVGQCGPIFNSLDATGDQAAGIDGGSTTPVGQLEYNADAGNVYSLSLRPPTVGMFEVTVRVGADLAQSERIGAARQLEVSCPAPLLPIPSQGNLTCGTDAGFESITAGQVTPCSAGRYKAVIGTERCQPCPQGQYGAASGATQCQQCVAGRFSLSPGVTICDLCAPGTFAANNGSIQCDDCSPGHHAPGQGATFCDVCAVGRFALSPRSIMCNVCAPGTFAANNGSIQCEDCSPGQYTPGQGATFCDDCSAGRFALSPRSTVCNLCAPGKFSADNASIQCDDCSPGHYAPGQGATFCDGCAVGHFSLGPGTTACERCTNGTHAAATGSVQCENCPRGKISQMMGATRCEACEAGYVSKAEGSVACDACPAGTYTDADGSWECSRCPPGSHAEFPAAMQCQNCSSGSVPSDDSTLCEACAIGMFAATNGSVRCARCPLGTFAGSRGSTQCGQCGDGSTPNSMIAAFECDRCGSPTYAFQGAAKCTVCASSFYQQDASMDASATNCKSCANASLGCSAGTTLETVELRWGYWRHSEAASQPHRCKKFEGWTPCRGGSDAGYDGNGYCEPGYHGPRCQLCTPPIPPLLPPSMPPDPPAGPLPPAYPPLPPGSAYNEFVHFTLQFVATGSSSAGRRRLTIPASTLQAHIEEQLQEAAAASGLSSSSSVVEYNGTTNEFHVHQHGSCAGGATLLAESAFIAQLSSIVGQVCEHVAIAKHHSEPLCIRIVLFHILSRLTSRCLL